MEKVDTPGSSRPTKPWTYRAENIPAQTTFEGLLNSFADEDRQSISIKTLAPAAGNCSDEDAGDLTATLSFAAADAASRPPRLKDRSSRITVDKSFYGLTPLNRPRHPTSVDVIAVTGLAGHAYGSWATKDGFMWLRDALPLDLPHARVLIYGYPSQLEDNDARSIIEDYAGSFIARIQVMRETARCGSRPMVLIGHSLGCLIIKQALVDTSRAPVGSHASPFPVCCVVFLGAPHRGLDVKALETLVKSKPTEDLIRELKSDSPTLTHLNKNFPNVVSDIRIISCYEKHPTPTVVWRNGKWERSGPKALMVSEGSAILHLPGEIQLAAFSNHSEIAKIMRVEGSIYHTLKGKIESAIPTPRATDEEEPLPSTKTSYPSRNHPRTTELVQLWPEASDETPYTGSNTKIDIVAIHGLAGDLYSTWKDGTRLWLRDFLPSQVQEARVLCFGYSASDALAWYGTGLENQAIHLLAKLSVARKAITEKSRKLLFICHDFGGILFKQALLLADRPDSPHRWFLEGTIGAILFGSPHHGPDVNWWSDLILRLLNGREYQATLLDIINDLAGISVKLGNVCSTILAKGIPGRIYSFFQSPMPNSKHPLIVDEQFAILKTANEIPMAFDTNHENLCKYISPSNVHYSTVVNSIKDVIDNDDDYTQQGLRTVELRFLEYLLRIIPESILRLLPDRWGHSCDWMLDHPLFGKLQHNQESRILWLHGAPGSGKTVLMKHVIRYTETMLYSELPEPKDTSTKSARISHCVIFFFCDDKDPLRNTTESILLSILYQILSRPENVGLFRHVDQDFLQEKGKEGAALSRRQAVDDQEILWKILTEITQKASGTMFWIFIDALDELKTAARTDMLLGIERVITGDLVGRVKLMLSSRSHVQEESRFYNVLGPLQIDMNSAKGVHHDVRKFLQSQVDTFSSRVRINVGYRQKLEEELIRVAAGTFLHASLAWATFNKGFSSEDPRTFMQNLQDLQQMPTDLESFYCGLLSSIPGRIRPVAKLAFSWVLASYEPLNLGQLCCAISIDYHNHRSFDEVKNAMDSKIPEKITEQCAFLIKVGKDGAVQFAHQSVKDLLLKQSASSSTNESVLSLFRVSYGEAHKQIARTCLAILRMREFSPGFVQKAMFSIKDMWEMSNRVFIGENVDEKDVSEHEELRARFEDALERYPLLQYSLRYWADHWGEGPQNSFVDDLIYSYIISPQADYFRLAAMPWTRDIAETIPGTLGLIAHVEPPLHILLQRGDFPGVVEKLLAQGHDVNQLDEIGLTPLHWAITKNRKSSFGILTAAKDLDPNRSHVNRPKPIHQAIYWRRTNLLSQLLDAKGIDINSRSKEDWTALHLSLQIRNISAVEVLLEDHRIDILARDENGVSAFELAFRLGHRETIIKRMVQLIDMKTALRREGPSEMNPLMTAGLWGWTDVERQILEQDRSQVLEIDNEGMNVLTRYAYWGRREKVEFFLKNLPAEALTYSYVGDRYNLLHLCAHQNWESVVHTLRTKFHLEGLDSDHFGRTLLHWAVENGWAYALADHSSKPQAWLDRQDRDGMTALHLAVLNRNFAAVQSLLAQGARFLLKDKYGKNAVHLAAEHSFAPALRLFLDTNVREFQRDHQGTALLHYMCMWQSPGIIEQYIVSKKALLNVRDKSRRTPLHIAARCGNDDAAKILLSRGAFIDARDSNLQTPLHYAIQEGHEKLIDTLEAYDADFQLRDGFLQTSLHMSIRQKQRAHHRYDTQSWGPVVDYSPDERVIMKIINKAPMVHYRDRFEKTPLHRACGLLTSGTAKKLIALGADLNSQDFLGLTPLHVSVASDRFDVTQTLLSYEKIKISQQDKRGCTPLDYALTMGNQKIISALLDVQATSTKNYAFKLRGLNPYWHKTDRYQWHTDWQIGRVESREPEVDHSQGRVPAHDQTTGYDPYGYPQTHRSRSTDAQGHDPAYDPKEREKTKARDDETGYPPPPTSRTADKKAHAKAPERTASNRKNSKVTYPMIRKTHIDVETLNFYDLPHRESLRDPQYWIITKDLSVAQTDFLFEHTDNFARQNSSLPLAVRQRRAVPSTWRTHFPHLKK